MRISPAPLVIVCLLTLSVAAQVAAPQTSNPSPQTQATAPAAPEVNAILTELQRVAFATSHDLGALRIERWRTDAAQKQDMDRLAQSLQRNLATILPGPATEFKAAPSSVAKSFKLYHNVSVVYDVLNSLADAAASLGKPEEYEPLAGDVNALGKIRQSLSLYTEQAAATLESQLEQAKVEEARLQAQVESFTQSASLRKTAFDDAVPVKKPRKAVKKTTSSGPGAQ